MWQALGGLLPIAVAVAVSSVPIMVTILLLLSPNRSKTAVPFLIGWVIGVVAVVGVSAVSAQALPNVSRRAQEKVAGVVELVIGAALIVLGLVQILRRSRSSASGMPRWLTAVDSFSGPVSFAVGVVLNVRPKGLLLGVTAGLALHAASVNSAQSAALVAIYTLIATSTVVIPIIASFLAPKKVQPKLISARDWIGSNGRVLTSAMLFMIGVVIFGVGLTHL
jgi:Sap, sulfolipid-1-addressing protein